MKEMKRVLALLLCFVMLVGLVPVSALNVWAAEGEEPIYVLAGGDFQEAGDHANSAANVKNILTQITQKYDTMDGFLFIGDYDCETHDSATETANGIAALMGAVQTSYSNIVDSNSVLVQGNHDYKDSRIDATGGHDFDGYSAYVLNEDDYPNGGGSQSQIQTLAKNLETWLNAKLGEGYDAPIFITSHLPLAFTPRTVTQGDAKYAKYIFDVLNAAAEDGLNIIFLHGHDHAYGPDNYMGGEAIYLPVGDKICIAEEGSTSKWTEETLKFTYMNAGYTGYYSDPYTYVTTAGTDKLTMTVFAIENNKVTVERYSANGQYNLKSAGYDGSYSNTSVTNQSLGLPKYSAVYASPQTISLREVQDYGTIGSWVGVTAETPADDVATKNNGWVEVIAPVPGTGADDVKTSGNSWVTLTQPSNGETIFKLTDTLTDGKKYVIVNRNTAGNGNAVNLNNNNSINSNAVTVIVDTNGTYIKAPATTAQWSFTNDRLRSVSSTNRYLRGNSNSLSTTTSTSSSYITWNYSNDDYGLRARYSGNYNSYRYMTSVTTTSNSSSNTNRVYIYVEDTLPGSNGLYAYLKGNLSYNATANMTAEQVLAMVKEGIAIQYATAADYSDEQNYPDDGEGMTWTLDPNYDPAVPGDYAVTIAFNGTTIGVAEVVVTLADQNGTYYKISGDLTYNVENGTSAEKVEDAVKTGITAYKYESMSKPGTNVTGTEVADSEITWVLDSSYNGNNAGDYAVTISKDGKQLGTAEVVVPATTTYYAAEGNGMYIVDMNTSAANAMAAVQAGVTVYSATDANGTGKTAISDDDVTWNWVDSYDGANVGPYTVEILKNGNSLGSVEVKVDVEFETGINADWTYIGETEATGGTTTVTYTLDTNGIDTGSGNKYIIVARNQAYLLNAGSAVAITISSDGKTATTSTRDYEYYFTGSTSGLITRDGTNTLYQQNWGIHTGYIEDSNLDRFTNLYNGYYRLYDGDGTNRSLYYDGDGWTVTNTDHTNSSYSVRLYKYTGSETVGGTSGGPIYAKLDGKTVYYVANGSSAAKAMNTVKEGITGYISNSADGTGATELSDSALTWTWKNKFSGSVDGSYWVEISYNGIVLGTVEVIVEPGVVDNYPEYPKEGAVKVNKTATGVDFQSSGIAQVEVSASGVPSKKGADVIVMLDTSSSMESWCICGVQNCSNSSPSGTYVEGATHMRRNVILEKSLEDLIAQFKKNGPDGQPLDIRVAIADFNGFNGAPSDGATDMTSGTPYDWDPEDTMSDNIKYDADNQAKVYTNTTNALDYTAFTDAEDLASSYTLNYTSGTNYDYAFDAIYQMGEASRNSGEDRDLYVIFMSDGAAMQWNYYHSQGRSDLWGEWITGTWSEDQVAANLQCTEHAYYYNLDDTNGDGLLNEHRMANAVKGSQNETFEVIRKTTSGIKNLTATDTTNIYTVPGLGAKVFSIAFDPVADGNVEADYMTTSIATLASEQTGTTKYYYEVDSANELSDAFTTIGSEIAYAAYNARFVDQMGSSFNLQMTPSTYTVLNDDGTKTEKTFIPDIQIISYDIYQRSQIGTTVNGVNVTEDMVGKRIGTSTTLETIKFSYTVADGTDATGAAIKVYTLTGAYSSLIDVDKDGTIGWTVNSDGSVTYDEGDNILGDGTNGFAKGVIYAKTFLYNTTDKGVAINGVNIPTTVNADNTTSGSTNVLPSETFYWKMGTIQTSELAMRYYVYLDGSMEGTKAAGSYQTNEFATLYYDNYLGNPCFKDTVSPVVAWKSAKVSYAFYLVNDMGEVVVNQTTGETGTFANKIALTSPVVYDEILLNNLDNVSSLEVRAISEDVLPDYYTLYDETAKYTVIVRSNTTGQWTIVYNPNIDGNGDGVADGVQSTYVTDFSLEDSSAYTNEQFTDSTAYDYTHTTVWFAVKWSIEAHPDTVVVDYGLPVDISVLSNDMFGDNGHLEAVGAYTAGIENTVAGETIAAGFSETYTGTYGTAKIDVTSGKVRYTPTTMDWKSSGNGYEKFAYAVNYTGKTNSGYYYDTITVIPATTVYYEDNFTTNTGSSYIAYGKYNDADNTEVTPGWQPEGTAKTNAAQAEDRPGRFSLSGVDANNVYGYDGAYSTMSTHSMGSAMKVHVDANTYATAEFSFYGTGLDIISMTTSKTGTLVMQIFNDQGKLVQDKNGSWSAYTVDTYFGYKYENGKWVVDEEADGALYQVPVLKAEGLPYGKYNVKLIATYIENFDHTTDAGYDLYLDAVRIYDPAGTEYGTGEGNNVIDSEIQDAYIMDGEGWPTYHELRNLIITAADFNAAETGVQDGVIFIDNTADDPYDNVNNAYTISDYTSFGPNNELYLAAGQSVTFELDLSQYIVDKTDEKGNPYKTNIVADVQIGLKSADSNAAVAYLKVYSAVTNMSKTASTSTSMYYSIKDLLDLGTDANEEKQDAKTILILQNNGDDSILSITDIKITLKEAAPPAAGTVSMFKWSRGTGEQALMMLRTAAVEDTDEPETTEPEATEPEATEPETEPTEPDSTELKAAVEAAKKLQKKNYTKESFKALESARKAAEKVLKDKKATQNEIDKALAELNAAVEALEAETPAAKPGKDEKPGKAEKEEQKQPASNKDKAENKQQERVVKIISMFLDWLLN